MKDFKIVKATFGNESENEGRDYSRHIFFIVSDNTDTDIQLSIHKNIVKNKLEEIGIELPVVTDSDRDTRLNLGKKNYQLLNLLRNYNMKADIVHHEAGDEYEAIDSDGNVMEDEMRTVKSDGYHIENPLNIEFQETDKSIERQYKYANLLAKASVVADLLPETVSN